jgi:hypothetical protein
LAKGEAPTGRAPCPVAVHRGISSGWSSGLASPGVPGAMSSYIRTDEQAGSNMAGKGHRPVVKHPRRLTITRRLRRYEHTNSPPISASALPRSRFPHRRIQCRIRIQRHSWE